MKTTTIQNRQEYWKYHSAAIAFQSASRLALSIRSMNEADEHFYDLHLAMHVLYSRPFKQQEAALRLSGDIVPKSHVHFHEALLYFRDKAFAHHDRKTMKIRDEDGDEFASLVITVQNGDLHARQMFPFLHPGELLKVGELCELLQQKCATNLSALVARCIGLTSDLADGIYRVSSRFDGEAPLLKKIN